MEVAVLIKILLIDQEHLFQKAFEILVERVENCHLVGVAETGIDAMKMVKKHHPHVVFSEILMGQENGIDICREIRSSFPDISTYILTNYRNLNLMNKAISAGIDNYLLKPISVHRLSEVCMEGEHQTVEEDESLRELLQSVEDRNYKKSYDMAKTYIRHLFDDVDLSLHRDTLKVTASKLFYIIPGMDYSQKKYYLQKYRLSSKTMSDPVLCYCWLVQIISEVYRQICAMKYSYMNKVLQYIENNINDEISLTELADYAGVSNGYLSRIFKKYYQISVVDYIHLRKLLAAKKYMVSSEMNISDISFLLGYSDAGYFSKIFKKYENMKPSAYMELF